MPATVFSHLVRLRGLRTRDFPKDNLSSSCNVLTNFDANLTKPVSPFLLLCPCYSSTFGPRSPRFWRILPSGWLIKCLEERLILNPGTPWEGQYPCEETSHKTSLMELPFDQVPSSHHAGYHAGATSEEVLPKPYLCLKKSGGVDPYHKPYTTPIHSSIVVPKFPPKP